MWFLAGLLLYGTARPITGRNAGGTLLLAVIGLIWVGAAVVDIVRWAL